ncbi:MAG TPA: HlyD family efflux transporter periplasmic adaptor subunit [Ideonella sp.]|nr:HlyD family efflux transporter periplasmic adaptor subunit [Ideonella sp.]
MQPLGLVWLTFGVLAALVAVSTFLFLGEYTRKARLEGVLVPDRGLIRVLPPVDGTVLTLAVHDGQAVRAGEVLLTLQVEAPSLTGPAQAGLQQTFDARTRSLDEAARQNTALAAERQRSLGERIEGLRAERAQLEAQAQLQQQRLALAEQALSRLESLSGDNFVSTAQVQAKKEDVLGLRADGAAIERQRQAMSREIAALEAEARQLPLETAQRRGTLERERAEINETAERAGVQAAERRLDLRAPADGVVSALTATVGQTVKADALAALVTLTPAGAQLQAHLYAPSSALGFVQPSQAVQLRLAAFPYQKFGLQPGRVLQVGHAPLQSSELADLPMARQPAGGEPLYRITVVLDRQTVVAAGQARALLPGMQLEGDVLLEKRRLIEWLFEPLLGLAKRI